MKYSKIVVFISLLWVLSLCAYAQDTLTLENFGEEEFEEPMLFGDGSKSGVMAKRVSLKQYCPPAIDQAGQPAGIPLGMAFGYGAMTILHASQAKWTETQLKEEAYSAHFPYELLQKSSQSCQINDIVAQLRKILTQTGNVKVSYDTNKSTCGTKPSGTWKASASKFRVGSLNYVFNKTSKEKASTEASIEFNTKSALNRGLPVVSILQIDDSFRQLKTGTWYPNYQGQSAIQPVVVVGFDESQQAFEVFNSMGATWGKNGFAWIKYKDFTAWSLIGLQMQWEIPAQEVVNPVPVKPKPQPAVVPAPPRPVVVLRGSGELRQVHTAGAAYQFSPLVVNRRGLYYETQKTFDIADRMQFVSNQLPRFGYVYVLSIDPVQKAALHFPEPGQSAYVADEASRLVFPRPIVKYDENNELVLSEQSFTKEVRGDDWLIVLYSKQKLAESQLQSWVRQLAVPGDQVVATLQQVLANHLVPWQSVKFETNSLRFSVQTNQGSIVPLIIKIK